MQCKCQGSCQAYYGSHEEAPILPKQSVPMKKHSEGSHGPNKESQLLLHLGREIVLADGTEAQSATSKGSGFLDELFQEVHSNESTTTVTIDSDVDDCEKYHKSNILQRAFPERMFALLVTLLFEIPVLLMISGGSSRLCALIGRSRYQLLIGFLPLSSAISGNVGLQASTLTTRAVSHYHITTGTYGVWFRKEVGAACFLGLAMGTVLGIVAFAMSGMDPGFALTIFMAQFVSILTAGVTGTFAPLLFTFVFHRDSGKWGGPLETAVQDIIGSFAMVVMSYHLLLIFPTREVEPWDVCGAMDTSS